MVLGKNYPCLHKCITVASNEKSARVYRKVPYPWLERLYIYDLICTAPELVHSDSPKIMQFDSIHARKLIRIDSSDSIRQLGLQSMQVHNQQKHDK